MRTCAYKNVIASMRLGLFDNPYCSTEKVMETNCTAESLAYGIETQKKAMVLLKNDGTIKDNTASEEKQTVYVPAQFTAGATNARSGKYTPASAKPGMSLAALVGQVLLAGGGLHGVAIAEGDNLHLAADGGVAGTGCGVGLVLEAGSSVHTVLLIIALIVIGINGGSGVGASHGHDNQVNLCQFLRRGSGNVAGLQFGSAVGGGAGRLTDGIGDDVVVLFQSG